MPSYNSLNQPNETRRTFNIFDNRYYVDLAALPQPSQPPPLLDPTPSASYFHWSGHMVENVQINYQSSIVDDLLIEPALFDTTPTPYPNEWPIGTILRLQNNFDSYKMILQDRCLNRDFPLAKVLEYKDGNINKIQWIGYPEIKIENWKVKYFEPANDVEIAEYNRVFEELNVLTQRPPIGKVLESLISRHPREMRAVVVCYGKDNKVVLKWTNRENRFMDGLSKWEYFRIADNQRGGFTPDPSNYCECESCHSEREISYTVIFNTPATRDNPPTAHRFCNIECVYEKGYLRCCLCNNYHINNTMHEKNEGTICNECYEQHIEECSECNMLYHQNNMRYNVSTLEWTCYRCNDIAERIIHDYSFKPTPKFNKMAWENTRYLGVELEVEHKSIMRDSFAKIVKKWLESHKTPDHKDKSDVIVKGKSLDKLVYFKNDGSLSNGIEIVFHPYTLKAFHLNFPVKEFLNFLSEQGADISSGKCGMHVHISKEKLTDLQLVKGKWLFFKCEQFLRKFSGRKSFNYCYFEEEPTNDPYRQEFGRHTAFNTASSLKTIEVRLFNATLEHKKFLANLQFSDVFVDYIQNGPGLAFLKLSGPHIVWQNFIDYAKRNGRYQVLTNYILHNAII